jgi:phosphatidylserine synthase 2
LILLFLFALPGAREVYQYLADSETKRMGAHAWLLIFNIMTETLICLKFSENEFHQSAPLVVKVGWSIVFAVLFVVFPLWKFVIQPAREKQSVKKDQ